MLSHVHEKKSRRYESVVREREDLRSRLDLSGSGNSGPLTEQKYQVRSFVFLFGWWMEGTRSCTCIDGWELVLPPPCPAPPFTSNPQPNQIEPIQDLKEEYRLYRKQALAALREKDAALAALSNGGNPPPSSSSSSSSTAAGAHNSGGGLDLGDPSVVYLRNLCEKFFSTESPEASSVSFGFDGRGVPGPPFCRWLERST